MTTFDDVRSKQKEYCNNSKLMIDINNIRDYNNVEKEYMKIARIYNITTNIEYCAYYNLLEGELIL